MLMRNAKVIYYSLFWNGNNGLKCGYFENNGLQSTSMDRRFWISYIKWYKFYNNNLSVVLVSETKGDVETRATQIQGLKVDSIADSLDFAMKTSKIKVRKCLKCVKNLSRRFDLANEKYFSNKQRRRRRASWKKTKWRQNGNRQRNNMIKSKQISFEAYHACDYFMT